MLPTFSLRTKIASIFGVMAVIVLAGGVSMLWYSYQIDRLLGSMVEKEIVLYKTAQDMELALANQKGFLTYYFVDGDGKWLKSLGRYREMFNQCLERASSVQLTDGQRQTLNRIDHEYHDYIGAKDRAIANYKHGTMQGSISNQHERQRDVFFGLLDLCRTFSQEQWTVIQMSEKANNIRSKKLRMTAFSAIAMIMSLGILFLFIIYKQVLGPIRGLAIETGGSPQDNFRDEVDSLKHSLQGMIRDFDETSDELARSRKHLLQAERMALVGELAAGVAHTIRNPFTSIKMRMFSLARSLELSKAQNEDLQVISDEIARIDRIVQNFLEFARPPKLRLEECCLGKVIKAALTLLEYRLRKYDVEVIYEFQPELSVVRIDADRIKEALVNLIINGCEAMENGGRITVTESRQLDPEMGEIAVITVSDNGPGIAGTILDKVTTPFFTTKEDGSGLGLSIVARIAQEHKGKFIVSSVGMKGTDCILQLPVGGEEDEHDTDN
jgi:signal transduction histidine kinase